MQKKLFSLLCTVLIAATILSVPTVAFSEPLKGGKLVPVTPDFVLAMPTPEPNFKKIPAATPSILEGATLATPEPTPSFVKTPATLPPATTPNILEGVTLVTPEPTPNFTKIPATLPPTTTPKILEGVTLATPAPTAEVKKPASLPEITKHPGAEIVDAGLACSFVALANNYDSISWFFKSGDTVVTAADAPGKFAGLGITGSDTTKIRLSSVPASLNGWEIGATFTNSAGSVNTNTCSITVKGGAAATAAPTPTAAPETPVPTSVPETPAPVEAPETPAPAASIAPTPAPTEAPKKESSGSILPIILGCAAGAAAACAVFFVLSRKNSGGSDTHYKGRH